MNSDLPLDIRLMQMATRAMLVVFAVLCLVVAGQWAVRHPGWTLQGIDVLGDTQHQDEVALRAQLTNALRTRVSSNFLTVDLQQVRELFESVPWVRSAIVQREFPNRLRVTLDEEGRPEVPEPLDEAQVVRLDRELPKFDHWWAFPVCAFDGTFAGNERRRLHASMTGIARFFEGLERAASAGARGAKGVRGRGAR